MKHLLIGKLHQIDLLEVRFLDPDQLPVRSAKLASATTPKENRESEGSLRKRKSERSEEQKGFSPFEPTTPSLPPESTQPTRWALPEWSRGRHSLYCAGKNVIPSAKLRETMVYEAHVVSWGFVAEYDVWVSSLWSRSFDTDTLFSPGSVHPNLQVESTLRRLGPELKSALAAPLVFSRLPRHRAAISLLPKAYPEVCSSETKTSQSYSTCFPSDYYFSLFLFVISLSFDVSWNESLSTNQPKGLSLLRPQSAGGYPRTEPRTRLESPYFQTYVCPNPCFLSPDCLVVGGTENAGP